MSDLGQSARSPEQAVSWEIREGDALERLREMPDESVQCVVTSPPYYGLRDYGTGTWTGGNPDCNHLAPPPGGHLASSLGEYNNGLSAEAIAAKIDQRRQQYRRECGTCGALRVDRQLGLESNPAEYVLALVDVFREVRRVLRDDGTVWLNLGDSYAGSWGAQSRGGPPSDASTLRGNGHVGGGPKLGSLSAVQIAAHPKRTRTGSIPAGAEYKPKDLLGTPWLVAFALRADGWWLRSDIVWAKPNPMPESVTDRPTSAYEHVFLLAKSARYFYDADAIREDAAKTGTPGHLTSGNGNRHDNHQALAGQGWPDGRNRRNVWEIATMPYPEAHFATFPPRLVDPCVRAGTSPRACGECGTPWRRVVEREYRSVAQYTPNETARFTDGRGRNVARMGDGVDVRTIGWEPTCGHEDGSGYCVVIDPFAGAGTTGLVALRQERSFIGIELNPDYAEMARRRIRDDAPLLNTHTERGELAGRGQSASSTEPPRRGESASPAEPPPRGDKTS